MVARLDKLAAMEDTFDVAEKSRLRRYIDAVPFLGEKLNPSGRVAVLRMAGVIADATMMRRAGINYHKFREAIADAFDVPRLKAVALIINSPGGAPAQCSLIANAIRRLADRKHIPVYAFVEDVAASGGYWLACAGDEIYAQGTSVVGSIGVISSGFGLDEFIAKHDIERRVHTSGRDKSFLDPFLPEKAEDVARLKNIQHDMHESFKAWVRERRAGRLNGDENALMEGAFWTGRAALERGLIDGIGDIGGVMREKFGDDIRFTDCTPEKKGWLSSLIPQLGGDGALFDAGNIMDAAQEKSAWGRFGL